MIFKLAICKRVEPRINYDFDNFQDSRLKKVGNFRYLFNFQIWFFFFGTLTQIKRKPNIAVIMKIPLPDKIKIQFTSNVFTITSN